MLILALVTLATALFAAYVVVPFVTDARRLAWFGPFRAGVTGLALSALPSVLVLMALNLDHLPGGTPISGRFWEAAILAGFCAIFWVPVFLIGFSRGRRAAKAPT